METPQAPKRKKTLLSPRAMYHKPGAILLTALLVLLGAILAVYFFIPKGERINSNGYQVVYMVSGQAYFGKLQKVSGDYLVVREPYTANDIKPEGTDAKKSQQPSTTLLKVSQQTYGPDDVISLKSDQVLFWQNLRDDSKVVQAIKNKQ